MMQALLSWRRAVFASLAILALAIQCLVVQTHIDIAAPRGDAFAVTVPATGGGGHNTVAIGTACAVCQASLSGVMALSGAPALVAAQPLLLASAGELAPALFQTPRSHTWRSRAPPRR